MPASEFPEIQARLRDMMLATAGDLDIMRDEPGRLQVYTRHIMKNKQPLYFGGVVSNKNYVSYHLMPVYVATEMLMEISPALKQRMQGKSCFNFLTLDESLFTELGLLTQKGFESYVSRGYIDLTP